jgi:4-hydroxybenzoate polyprenyltransferase
MIYNAKMLKDQLLPIAVDLDGTLVNTDTLHESCLQLLHHQLLKVFSLPFWLIKGKAYIKQKLSERTSLNPSTLPYNFELISWLKKQKALGHRLILCTAANRQVANDIANHLNLFDEVIASNGQVNMAGSNKRQALVKRFAEQGFIYAANSSADLKVWQSAAQAVVVNANTNLSKKAASLTEVVKTLPSAPITLSIWRRVFRVHQYLKNLLLFVPLAAAHQISQVQSISLLMLAFASFSLCASSVYITNDLIDLESDRLHPRKCNRPFAAGLVPIKYGVMLMPISLLTSLALATLVGNHFLAWLIAYFAVTLAYSLRLKRYVLIDCLALATLYTFRIIAGAAAVAIGLSFWLLAFSIFLFLSLAFVKRYAELEVQILHGNSRAHGRGYHVEDAPLIQTLGITAGYAAVLVLALYLNSEAVISLYATPQLIWLAIPLMLFWVSWMWMKAHRGLMHDDPIVFAIKDRVSVLIGALFMAILILASIW